MSACRHLFRLFSRPCNLLPSIPALHVSSRLKTAPFCWLSLHHPTHHYHHRSLSASPPDTPLPRPPTTADHTHPFEEEEEDLVIPAPPTNCCMSGCANCVWITYAQELAEIYKDSGRASERVMKAIDDPSLKIFLNLELKELLKEESSNESDSH